MKQSGVFSSSRCRVLVALGALFFTGVGTQAQILTYVGSWVVDQGPLWSTSPPAYSGQTAAVLLFSGATGDSNPADYRISTISANPAQVNNEAWYDTYGGPQNIQADNAITDATYTTPGAISAYVLDHGNTNINYAFLFQAVSFESTPGLTGNQRALAVFIDQNAANLTSIVTPLASLPTSAIPGALDQLSPLAFGQFTTSNAFNNASFAAEQMDQYFAARRGANGTFISSAGGIDSSGLTVNDPAMDPMLSQVHSRLLAWNPAPNAGVISDVANPLLGGVVTADLKDLKAMTERPDSHKWNAFIQGNVVLAQGLSQNDVSHFDSNTSSVVVGADYLFTPHFLAGVELAYGHTDVTLDDAGSSATADSYSPGLYASYMDGGWYANATANYAHNAYTQDRVISFLGETANSAPEGDEVTAQLDGGYDFHRGNWTFGPTLGLEYTHLRVNGYDETGAALDDLSVNQSDADSLRSKLGGRVSYVLHAHGITFTPHLDASWQHEFMDQSRGLTSQFDGLGVGSFSVQTPRASRDSVLASAGLDADLNRTVTVFADYSVQAGQDNYFGQQIEGGVRLAF